DPQAGGDRGCTTVDRVEAVGVHVVGVPARASDARDEDDVFLRNAEVRHRLLDRAQDRVVTTPGTPADVLIGLEVLLGQLARRFGRAASARLHLLAPQEL